MVEQQLSPKTETLKLSALFFVLFTATNSFHTMLTFIYEQEGLTAIGPANIAVTYIAFICSTIYAPSCRLRIKFQIMIVTIAYTLNFSTGLLIPLVDTPFKYMLTCLGAGVCGLSAGLLWVSQGRYIHLVCERAGQAGSKLKAECFGLFSLIYCMSHISAGLITTFGLGLFNVEVYFCTVTATGLLSVLISGCLLTNIRDQPRGKIGQSGISRNQLAQALQPSPVEELPEEESSLKDVFKYYPKMSSILWILVIDGVCYGIHISEITHMIPQDTPADKLNLYAGFCNIALGCGASLGGWISGQVASKVGGKPSGAIGIGMFLFGSMLALGSLEVQNMWLTMVSVFVWGFFLFYIEGWLFIICSRQFKGRSQSFSVNKQLGSITCFLFQILVIFTSNNMNLSIVIGVVCLLALPAFHTLRKLPPTDRLKTSLRTTHESL